VGLRIGAYGKESGLSTWLIVIPVLLAVLAALVLPTTLRRRRRAHA
jgi:MYXO-CTERM domain-containing protein